MRLTLLGLLLLAGPLAAQTTTLQPGDSAVLVVRAAKVKPDTVTLPPRVDTLRLVDSLYCALPCPPGTWSKTKPVPPAPTLTAVKISPKTSSVVAGSVRGFSATRTWSDGLTRSTTLSWSATGGSITTTGSYTGGMTPGAYRVIVAAQGKADTATVTVTAPAQSGIAVPIGQSIQAATDANPAGSTFLLAAGTHVRQRILAKPGNKYIGVGPATILDGQGVTDYAFTRSGSNPDSVTIRNLRITNYTPAQAQGPILGGGDAASSSTEGWLIEDVECDHSTQLCIRVGNRMVVRRVNLHHNGLNGIGGVGDDVLVEQSEIAYNGVLGADDVGGTKFVLGNRLIFRNNYVHHNNGPGLWGDIGNRRYLMENNRVEDNLMEGIAIEISHGPGVIRNNTIKRNGLADSRRTSWLWGAGIAIAASDSVEVYGNLLEGNAHGIALIQQKRGTNYPGEPPAPMIDPEMYVHDTYVHDNVVICGPGSLTVAGGVDDSGALLLFTSRNNRFARNTYVLAGCSAQPFAWMGGYRSQAQWAAYGEDQ